MDPVQIVQINPTLAVLLTGRGALALTQVKGFVETHIDFWCLVASEELVDQIRGQGQTLGVGGAQTKGFSLDAECVLHAPRVLGQVGVLR